MMMDLITRRKGTAGCVLAAGRPGCRVTAVVNADYIAGFLF
jgi:hypothetical protein